MKKLTLLTAILMVANLLSAQWVQQNPYYPQNGHALKDIFFIDQEQGWTVGEIESLSTTDGGNNWDWMFIGGSLHCVFFVDNLNGWVCGESGIWHTNDGGIDITGTWEQQLDMSPLFSKLFFIDTLTGWYVATYSASIHLCEIYKTIDGGSTWIQKFGPVVGHLNDITFSDNLNGWAVGGFYIGNSNYSTLHTNDGGETWEEMTSAPTDIGLNSVFFVDSLNGWTAGNTYSYPYYISLIYHTDNGGENWVVQYDTLASSFLLNDITFTDLNNGWAVGRNGNIIHTSDGGQNWEYQESGTTAELNSVCFVDENHGWICGDSAIILHTDNGGIVGINENSISKSKLAIYPNPTNDIATVSFELAKKETITLCITNTKGQEIKQISLGVKEKDQSDLDFSNYSPGIYFIALKTDSEILTKKLIIK